MAREERTEKATPRHRQRSRKRGQVARSGDVGGSLVLAGGLFVVNAMGPRMVDSIGSAFRHIFSEIASPGRVTSAAGLRGLEQTSQTVLVATVGPVAGACLAAGLLAGAAQVGFRPHAKPLSLEFRRLNPVSGARNLFGPNILFETAKAVVKIGVISGIVALALIPGLTALAADVGMSPSILGEVLGQRAFSIAQRAVYVYLAIAVIDYAWQRRRHERGLRMTKQEVKDELRQHGLPAEVMAAQRRRRMQMARNRMMAAVPKADVVVTNPTHFAVALGYDGSSTAPEVLAKGKDLIAAQIRRIAEENDVPIVADPPLARALHGSTEVGQMIPHELYTAVAQVLAFVYRAARRRRYAA
jgi:flagellar biosynthetic protein FlhB